MLALLLLAPVLVRGPVLVGVAPDHAFVAWETSESQSNATVRFGASAGSLSQSAVDSSSGENHHVQLTGLQPGTTYHYAVDSDTSGADNTFTTAPAAGARTSFRFGVYGDNRTQVGPHQSVVDGLQREGPLAFLVQTGDMAENLNPLDNGWDTFFALEHELLRQTPFYPAVGNHETLDGLSHWSEFFAFPSFAWPTGTPKYYSIDWAQLHLIFLDTFEATLPDTEGISQAQVEWMKADLDGARSRGQLIVAVMHHGPYSHSQHGDNPQAQQLVVPELVARGAAGIFQGHDHVYERGCLGGIDYLLAGGGGAPLYDVDAGAPGVQRAISDYSYAVFDVSGSRIHGVGKLADGGVIDDFVFPSGACSDAGTPDLDGGSSDGGSAGSDGGSAGGDGGTTANDGGSPAPDAGQSDGGSPLPTVGGNCSSAGGASFGALALLVVAIFRRRTTRLS